MEYLKMLLLYCSLSMGQSYLHLRDAINCLEKERLFPDDVPSQDFTLTEGYLELRASGQAFYAPGKGDRKRKKIRNILVVLIPLIISILLHTYSFITKIRIEVIKV
ncbi:unnamed protein product [Orchesella dallaii]|uniref:Uncharacterized protein n=1 Tax=Orchesella dallaii TaxID=48710 RepID=A0ABP1S142_9HEXA